jgi:hypothetical protein
MKRSSRDKIIEERKVRARKDFEDRRQNLYEREQLKMARFCQCYYRKVNETSKRKTERKRK